MAITIENIFLHCQFALMPGVNNSALGNLPIGNVLRLQDSVAAANHLDNHILHEPVSLAGLSVKIA